MTYIVVLNWNGISDTIACLSSLLHLEGKQYKIIICDNGSTDDSISSIRKWYELNKDTSSFLSESEFATVSYDESTCFLTKNDTPGLFILDIGENLGYAGGNNVGIRFAKNQSDMDYVWLLNNDTVVQPNSLIYLLNEFDNDSKVGICGSKLVYFDERDKIQGLGGIINSWFCTSKHYKAFENPDDTFNNIEVARKIDYVIGASMLISKSLIDKVGVLCEDYFLYYEEIDYCIRARRANYMISVACDSLVFHKEGASTKKIERGIISDYYAINNRLKIARKFYPLKYPIVYISIFFALVNRLKRKEYTKAKNIINILLFRKVTQ